MNARPVYAGFDNRGQPALAILIWTTAFGIFFSIVIAVVRLIYLRKNEDKSLLCMLSTVVVLSHVPPIYAADKFPDYPVRPAGEYAVTAEKAGLTIGVQPVEDPKDQKTYFNTVLTAQGFLPVFIVLQNGASGDSFLFDKTAVTYGPADSSLSAAPSPNNMRASFLADRDNRTVRQHSWFEVY